MRQNSAIIFFCTLNCILLLLNLYEYLTVGQLSSNEFTYVGDDFPPLTPILGGSLPEIDYTFEESTRFRVNNASLDAWYGNLARQLGYVRLGPERRIFAVSMHHQQHCLYFFAQSLAELRKPDDHTKHCLNYLRQNILCQADTTLEPPYWIESATEDRKVGFTRKCHDWRTMYKYVEDNYQDWMSFRKEHWEQI